MGRRETGASSCVRTVEMASGAAAVVKRPSLLFYEAAV
jgi:hypothetical protein